MFIYVSNEKKLYLLAALVMVVGKSVNPWPVIVIMIKAFGWCRIFACYQCKLIIFVRFLNYSIKNVSLSKPAKTIWNNKSHKINCIFYWNTIKYVNAALEAFGQGWTRTGEFLIKILFFFHTSQQIASASIVLNWEAEIILQGLFCAVAELILATIISTGPPY